MSNLDPPPGPLSLQASVVTAVDVLEARKAAIGDGTEGRRAAARTEESPHASRPARLHGVQLWIALPGERPPKDSSTESCPRMARPP